MGQQPKQPVLVRVRNTTCCNKQVPDFSLAQQTSISSILTYLRFLLPCGSAIDKGTCQSPPGSATIRDLITWEFLETRTENSRNHFCPHPWGNSLYHPTHGRPGNGGWDVHPGRGRSLGVCVHAAWASVPVTLGLWHRRGCVQRRGRSVEVEVEEGSRLRGVQALLCHEIILRPSHKTSYIFSPLICDKRQKY